MAVDSGCGIFGGDNDRGIFNRKAQKIQLYLINKKLNGNFIKLLTL